jgi:phage/conjugal plasmid C-4 type zinc finger TraR family protein
MDFSSERAIEIAEAATSAMTARAIHAAKAGLAGEGCAECEDCGDDIPAARRAALPSARRCVGCQTAFESGRG